jgi:hypothetical protein
MLAYLGNDLQCIELLRIHVACGTKHRRMHRLADATCSDRLHDCHQLPPLQNIRARYAEAQNESPANRVEHVGLCTIRCVNKPPASGLYTTSAMPFSRNTGTASSIWRVIALYIPCCQASQVRSESTNNNVAGQQYSCMLQWHTW